MRADEWRARLREADVPDEAAARERAWRVVTRAYAEREPMKSRRRRSAVGAALIGAACAALAGLALTAPGEAVGDWVREVVRSAVPVSPQVARPALTGLPGHGRLLVVSADGPWIVAADGARRRLGAYEDAAFSPRALFVAATRGRMVVALDPRGRVRWTLSRSARVTDPRWSLDGLRVAYRSGAQLRVVYGDGAFDRQLAARSAAVAPAWRPGAAHRLAYVDARGAVVVRDADSGRRVWRVEVGAAARQLAWSPDGRRLLVVTATAVHVVRGDGSRERPHGAPAGARVRSARWLPSGRAFVLLRSDLAGRRSEALLARAEGTRERRILGVTGRLAGMLVSPDGRWLLLSAPAADQWLLVRIAAGGRITALSDIARQFDPGGRGSSAAPRLAGWCC